MISVEGSDFNEFAWYLDNVTQINQHQIRGRFLISDIQIESEVASLYLLDEFNTNVTGEYVTNSRLHPGILELFQKIQRQENMTKDEKHGVFVGEQWKLVTDTVKVCNRFAILIPELFALQLAQSMRKVDGLKLDRLKARDLVLVENVIGSAGRVAEQEYVRAAEVAVEKPTMKGNVVVIFYLFCGVCGLSIFSFVVESVENLQKQEWLKIDPNYENTDAQSLKFCVNDFRGVMGLEDRVKLNNSILTTIPILCGPEKEEKRYVITEKLGESLTSNFLLVSTGDDDDFDAVEAHSFSPMFGNEIHFNDDREWNIGSFSGVDTFKLQVKLNLKNYEFTSKVALLIECFSLVHEIAHILGLGHYQRSDSIMYPNDVGYISNFSLHTDDIKAIQIIYGKKRKYSIPLWLTITWTALATAGIACMLLGIVVTIEVIFRYCKRKSEQTAALLEKSWLWDVEPEMDSEPTLGIDHSLNL
ncbi:Matrilysin [Orchesella cincta]|uniref:Matrilysin n=1 Tax=Orchesella cincta TaxID=48709 RepID=A0A1D2M257_ORCCI|nr:Matrilysin [Orchesella cincta]